MKRFTETTKWDDPWFIRLSSDKKLLWLYICDRCDASGVIDFCPELASVQIGCDLTEEDLVDFGSRVEKMENGKWQIIKFLSFQYGTVDAHCPAHKPVIRCILSNGVKYPIDNLSDRVSNTLKEKNKEKEKEGGVKRGRPVDQKDVEDFCVSIGLSKSDGEAMWLEWQERGFGKTKDWKAKIRKWKIYGYHPSQKNSKLKPTPIDFKPNYLPPPNEISDDEREKFLQSAKAEVLKFKDQFKLP